MPVKPQGSVIPGNFREHLQSNPPQTSNITAGGTQGTASATIATAQTGLGPGMLVRVIGGGGADENAQVLNYASGTGVLTFAANLANVHDGGGGSVQWGYTSNPYDTFLRNATSPQTPFAPGQQLETTYVVNQKYKTFEDQVNYGRIQT